MAELLLKDNITYVALTDAIMEKKKIEVMRYLLKYMREKDKIEYVKKGNTYFYPKEKLERISKLFL